jgi:hypothetical protein
VRRALLAWAALLLASTSGCFRLSDPIYTFKDIRAVEPSHEGMSLLFGTIVVDEWMTGDLSTVTLTKLGPGQERTHWGANRVNLFRAFFRRTMKDGNFIIEVEPGLYELDGFSTSGWGQPRVWTAREGARQGSRILVTRPGVYDIGTIRVVHSDTLANTYDMERVTDSPPERRMVLARAIGGTRWESLSAPAR